MWNQNSHDQPCLKETNPKQFTQTKPPDSREIRRSSDNLDMMIVKDHVLLILRLLSAEYMEDFQISERCLTIFRPPRKEAFVQLVG